MSVKIADCTIRDGGYLLNKNSNPSFVKEVLSGLSKAGIDFVEIGYLQTKSNGETLVLCQDLKQIKMRTFQRQTNICFLSNVCAVA